MRQLAIVLLLACGAIFAGSANIITGDAVEDYDYTLATDSVLTITSVCAPSVICDYCGHKYDRCSPHLVTLRSSRMGTWETCDTEFAEFVATHTNGRWLD